jgi:hypothetical protein
MLIMATVGLTFALKTVGFRRSNDTKGAQPPEPETESRQLPPSEWPGLGYLPDDVQAVAGIRVGDAMASPAGRTLIGSLNLSGEKTLLGVRPGDVNHLILGANVRKLPPRLYGIVHGQIEMANGAGRTTEHNGKSLVRERLSANGPEVLSWRPDRHLLVAAQLAEDFDPVPSKPRPAPLPELIQRLDPAALAWLVASVDADNAAVGFAANFLPPAAREVVSNLSAIAVSISADGTKLTLTAHVRGRTADGGRAIAKSLADSLAKPASEVTVNPSESGDWYRIMASGDAEKLAGWLRTK